MNGWMVLGFGFQVSVSALALNPTSVSIPFLRSGENLILLDAGCRMPGAG